MANAPAALQAVELSVRLSGRQILKAVDLVIAPGEIVALTGDNGAGKTTLLRCLAGLTQPNSGAVYWQGRPAARWGAGRAIVGLTTHESSLYPYLTARENLVFAARMHGLAQPAERASTWLEDAALLPFADQQAAALSKGTRQRLALARALIHEPAIVLLDEPFTGLDARSLNWLTELLRTYRRQGRAVCFSTHDLSTAHALADRAIRLERGCLDELPAHGARPSRAA